MRRLYIRSECIINTIVRFRDTLLTLSNKFLINISKKYRLETNIQGPHLSQYWGSGEFTLFLTQKPWNAQYWLVMRTLYIRSECIINTIVRFWDTLLTFFNKFLINISKKYRLQTNIQGPHLSQYVGVRSLYICP